ncbi:hypothetical protein [Pseudomonas abietaniphila]|uniref:Uncharacterized protein n=1 Tax=Pseudomonas abietaniphila TaxID=89065 RepID=A0A1G8AEW4_9PSED|nr:hypothetical protein [Pseudomonas abietaniphila]SDH18860.1 hypothetical protein SAMN05216605_10516 [Pseudomonas abietaniphila]
MFDFDSRWLSVAVSVALIVHAAASYIFYRKYLEVIEEFLSDIELVKKHRDAYGNHFLGRRMREIAIVFVIMVPGMYKRQEVIPMWKVRRVPAALRFGVKFHFYSSVTVVSSMALLYYAQHA